MEDLSSNTNMPIDAAKRQKLLAAANALSEVMGTSTSSQVTQEHFDEKINTVNQNIGKVYDEIKKNNDLLVEQNKMKRLELASSRTSLLSFNYYDGNDYDTTSSCQLAKDIIYSFIMGCGYPLPNATMVKYDSSGSGKSAFRKNIVKQIKQLIGHDPRLIDNGNGSFAIYYK